MGNLFSAGAGIELLTWSVFEGSGAEAVVTNRHGGVSTGPYAALNLALHVGDDPESVIENRRRAAEAIGLDLGDLVFCNQAHGRVVAEVGAAERGRGCYSLNDAVGPADVLVTDEPGVGLVVMVADCVPLVLFEPVSRTLACVHAGWRGTVRRVAQAALEAMAQRGARPDRVLAGIGPAVDPSRYQVGPEVDEAAHDAFGDWAGEVLAPDPQQEGRWLFDLWESNRRTLLESGVAEKNIEVARLPTGPPGDYFSDRSARPCGRFAALARLAP